MSIKEMNISSLLPKSRKTFYIRMDLIDKLRAYAYWERRGISETVNIALDEFFKNMDSETIPGSR
ncbi:hypothetical protein FJZ33_00940 [Candidatus Poribacteria bacterium]|nr:hypothetical protein [Candidatus Poribacteria bacterium]